MTDVVGQAAISDSTSEFRIAMLGPSRIGKTSIIAALLHESRGVLAGTTVRMNPSSSETRDRIQAYEERLQNSLNAGTFQPEIITHTEDYFIFDLKMNVVGARLGSPSAAWSILDYPGSWIDPRNLAGVDQKKADIVTDYILNANVLIIPTDAAAIMTAQKEGKMGAVNDVLETLNVRELAREWANRRAIAEEEGLVILSPVKCESYFDDNGGTEDQSVELQKNVISLYNPVLRAIAEEFYADPRKSGLLNIHYVPIDTIGCVRLKTAQWTPRPAGSEKYNFTASYTIRGQPIYRPKAAREVMTSICHLLLDADSRRRTARNESNLLSLLWDVISNQSSALAAAVRTFAKKPRGSRFREVEFQTASS